MGLLESWSARGTCNLRLSTVAGIYTRLHPHAAELAPRLASSRWIFYPAHVITERASFELNSEPPPVRGAFHRPSDCAWEDEVRCCGEYSICCPPPYSPVSAQSHLFDRMKPSVTPGMAAIASTACSNLVILSPAYSYTLVWAGMMTQMGVPLTPSLSQYRAVLLEAASGRHSADASFLAAQRVFGSFASGGVSFSAWAFGGASRADDARDEWGEEGTTDDGSAQFADELRALLAGDAVVPVCDSGWSALENILFVDDSSEALAEPGRVVTGWGAVVLLPPELRARCVSLRRPNCALLPSIALEKLKRFYCNVMGVVPLSAAALERCLPAPDAHTHASFRCRELVVAAAVLQRWSAAAMQYVPSAREALYERLITSSVAYQTTPLSRELELHAGTTSLSLPLPDASASPTRVFLDFPSAAPPTLVFSRAAGDAPLPPAAAAQALARLLGPLASSWQRNEVAALLAEALTIAGPLPPSEISNALEAFLASKVAPPGSGPLDEPPWLEAGELLDWAPPAAEDAGLALALAASAAEAEAVAAAAERSDGGAAEELTGPDAALEHALAAVSRLSQNRVGPGAREGGRVGTDGGGDFGGGGGGSIGGVGVGVGSGSGGGRFSGFWRPSTSQNAVDSFAVEEWEGIVPAAPPLPNEPADETAQHIGRWGEQMVAQLLKMEHPQASLQWLNESAESGQPYDIELRAGGLWELVEVKTTARKDQEARFSISLAELECARRHSAAYSIYRVCLSDGRTRVLRLRDPVAALEAGAWRLELST